MTEIQEENIILNSNFENSPTVDVFSGLVYTNIGYFLISKLSSLLMFALPVPVHEDKSAGRS